MVFHKSDILTPNLFKVLLGNNENINIPQSCLFGVCNDFSFLVNCFAHRWPCIIKQWVNHLHSRMSYSYRNALLTDHFFWKLSFQNSRFYPWTSGLILSLFVLTFLLFSCWTQIWQSFFELLIVLEEVDKNLLLSSTLDTSQWGLGNSTSQSL